MIALTPDETWWYQLKADRKDGKPDPDGSWFELGHLTAAQRAKVTDGQFAGRQDPEAGTWFEARTGTAVNETLRYGLRGWRNVRDAQGAEVEFKRAEKGRPAESTLNMIPADAAGELSNAIMRRIEVSAAEGN